MQKCSYYIILNCIVYIGIVTGSTQIISRGHIHLQNNHIQCALHIVSHT